MHDDEYVADAALVRRLVAAQFPAWCDDAVVAVPPTGTDNLIFRLGRSLVVRMPRIASATSQVRLDHVWLPQIAPRLPCPIPTPMAVGDPSFGYPFPWAVHTWLAGDNPRPGDDSELAEQLAGFVVALRTMTVGPPSSRSGPLSERDEAFRRALAQLTDELDADRAAAVWDTCVTAQEYDGTPVWRHADLTPGNLLVRDGRLTGVLDFGPSGLGDPAVDLVPAWRVFRGTSRTVFRRSVGGDDAMWARAFGWALSIAVLELAYYRHRDRALADAARAALRELFDDTAAP